MTGAEERILLRAQGIEVEFDGRPVLRGIDLDVRRGEVLFLLGPSGCGKTTLMKCMSGLLPPTRGSVLFDGVDLHAVAEAQRDRLRLRMGMAFQGGALFNSLSVIENVALPLRERTPLPAGEILAIARLKLAMVGLGEASSLLPASLSGGMRKRAAIARALALDPEVLFLDEPTTGLDPITAAGIDDLVSRLNRAFGVTVVAVSHDIASARAAAHRAALLGEGRIAALAPPAELEESADPAIAEFVHRRLRPRPSAGGADLFAPEEGA
ncbi:MAG TPA: ATP-binding cassette domain-containing protein [Planctomycetota bacterium]|jgi:phospholipid/cholesterol/gamma-HCH transport system ATP-binding protein|nr:ATP-binding cassette domain-containing protein [Planctomycetota bacterium]